MRQEKTGWEGDVPIGDELAAVLATVPVDNMTFLTTAWDRPYTAAGFGNHFASGATRPGCNHAAPRTAYARRRAVSLPKRAARHTRFSGHITLAEVQRYTKAVDQAALARAAAKKRTKIGEPSTGSPKRLISY